MAVYECQNFKNGQVLVANSLNKIEDALAGLCNNGPIFTATYGSTTSAELKTAYDEGNTLVLKGYIDNMDCVLSFTLYDETNNEFTFTGVDCDKIISATLKDDIWARSVAQTGHTYSFAEGTKKGAIAVTTNGETENITVHGLGGAAFLDADSFEQSGKAKKALEDAKTYTDEKISALINGAPTTLDTLDEIAAALKDNDNIVTTLEQSIGSKANASDLTALSNTVEGVANTALSAKSDVKDLRVEISPHLSNTSNPHKVTAEQVGAIPASGSNARPTYNDKDLAFKSDIRTYSLKKDGSTIKLIGSDGEETSVTDTEGSTIFVVIRGQTSFAECVNAYNAGKLLYCDIYNNGCVFPCVWADVETHFAFAGVFPDGKTMLSVQLLEDQGWQDMVATEIPADVSLATGTLNGTIEITKNGTKTDVVVKGLGTAAYCDMGTFDTSGAASTALSNAKTYTDEKVAALVNGAPDTLNTLDELAAALKDNAGIVDTLNEAIGKKANASDLTNLQAQVNKKANDYSIEIYNGTGGNPKPVRFASFNYSTCNSENGIAAKISMVSGHGNGSSYAFLQDAIIRVSYLGSVEVDNFKYYGAETGTYDGENRQYGDIFWLIDTTNKIVDFYVLMGQYARVYQTPWKRLTYSTGGAVTQHTSCTVYSSGTKAWANNNDIALMSDIPEIDTEDIYSSIAEAKSDVKDMRESLAAYETKTDAERRLVEAREYTQSCIQAASRENADLYEFKIDANSKLNVANRYTDNAFSSAKSYTDTAIANLINSAPTTLDTLGEIATAMKNNADVVTALEQSIGNKANSTHNHSAADINAGTLPLSYGGTGTSLAKTNNAIIRFSGSGNYFSKTATASGAMYATSANGAPTFGTLPIAQGGTGATDAATALSNLGGLPMVGGKAVQGSPSADSSISSMNRFQSDLFVQGDGAAPNTPQVAGFYLGKSATDENRHMDIVSGDTYSYIDFNKAGNNLDFDVRLLVNVDNGYTDFTWDGSKTARVLNVQGAIQQYGQAVALKSEVPSKTETWTFTLEDGSTVTKAVYVG